MSDQTKISSLQNELEEGEVKDVSDQHSLLPQLVIIVPISLQSKKKELLLKHTFTPLNISDSEEEEQPKHCENDQKHPGINKSIKKKKYTLTRKLAKPKKQPKDAELTKQPEVCKFFLTGSCKSDQCPFSHNLKLVPCKYLHGTGICEHGISCKFSHDRLKDDQLWKFIEDNEAFLYGVYTERGTTNLGPLFMQYLGMKKQKQEAAYYANTTIPPSMQEDAYAPTPYANYIVPPPQQYYYPAQLNPTVYKQTSQNNQLLVEKKEAPKKVLNPEKKEKIINAIAQLMDSYKEKKDNMKMTNMFDDNSKSGVSLKEKLMKSGVL